MLSLAVVVVVSYRSSLFVILVRCCCCQVPGFEWCVIQLGIAGTIEVIEIDTNHFRGNFPESFQLEGCVGKVTSEGCLMQAQC